ncbi:ATP phosphoribosyltransferase [Candidatus Hodgkinia cicadicola]|nr:ATP phosphoribosyltransferase [Candidatus Hodgkinia cicadicola]
MFALPSKGRINVVLSQWLSKLGLTFVNPSARRYWNSFVGYPNIEVKLMPAELIVRALIRGDADFGLTGLDLVSELSLDKGMSGLALYCKYDLCRADVSVLVPKCWLDFNCLSDLKLLSLLRRVRVSTKYVNLARQFFRVNQLSFLEVFRSENVTELEPFSGRSDFVVDIVSTGDTVKDNALKCLRDGVILNSSLCLFYKLGFEPSGDALSLIQTLSKLPNL